MTHSNNWLCQYREQHCCFDNLVTHAVIVGDGAGQVLSQSNDASTCQGGEVDNVSGLVRRLGELQGISKNQTPQQIKYLYIRYAFIVDTASKAAMVPRSVILMCG